MRLPRGLRQQAVRRDPVFQRETLARLFAYRAESALLEGVPDLEAAEMAAAVALALDAEPGTAAGRTAALACWLLGKCHLHDERWLAAEESFAAMAAFVPPGASGERGLAAAGLAQVRVDQGARDEAVALFTQAVQQFCQLEDAEPAAACRAQAGILLQENADYAQARPQLRAALEAIDLAAWPSLAARLLLSLAICEAALGSRDAARERLYEARLLYDLPAAPGEDLERAWLEAGLALASGQALEALGCLTGVRGLGLAQDGSLADAAQPATPELPPRPLPLRRLTDRLLRRIGEHEDPLGRAPAH